MGSTAPIVRHAGHEKQCFILCRTPLHFRTHNADFKSWSCRGRLRPPANGPITPMCQHNTSDAIFAHKGNWPVSPVTYLVKFMQQIVWKLSSVRCCDREPQSDCSPLALAVATLYWTVPPAGTRPQAPPVGCWFHVVWWCTLPLQLHKQSVVVAADGP